MTDIVRARQVTYRYPQNNHGLAPVSLNLGPGDAVHVAGPSGCGKSTLARCLTGLIPHLYRGQLEGEVWLDGCRTTDTPLWQLAERAGLVFQNPAAQMLAMSVEEEIIFGLENLGLSAPAIDRRLQETLARFELEGLRSRSPQTLSGGEQQKLALAAITARRPPVLVLDEPLSMLDGTAAADLVAHLSQLSRSGTSVVVCEHRAERLQTLPDLQTFILTKAFSAEPPSRESQSTPLPMPPSPPFQLEVSNLGVELGGRPVLQNLNLRLAGGQVVAVVGRNGVGKTTLLRALAGLQKHNGEIRLDGDPPDLGLVFQNADLQLFNASVRDELLYRLPQPDMALYAQLLDRLGLSPYQASPPLLLSEGEKKRVALATVLMRQPRHGLLLDEPSLGQDEAHKARLIQLVRGLAAVGRLVVLTTHDLGLAVRADRLLLLGPQGFVADGPPSQVLDDRAAWAELGLSVPEWVRDACPPSSEEAGR